MFPVSYVPVRSHKRFRSSAQTKRIVRKKNLKLPGYKLTNLNMKFSTK